MLNKGVLKELKKKILLLVLGLVLLLTLFPATVLAGPPEGPNYGKNDPHELWDTEFPFGTPEEIGLEKIQPSSSAPGGEVHIVTDPLAEVGTERLVYAGWVTFWCQSKIGFQYNIGTELDDLSRYIVEAQPLDEFFQDEGDPIVLGSFQTDVNGMGGVRGVHKLEDGPYEFEVRVYEYDDDTKGDQVLEAGREIVPIFQPIDYIGFVVY